MPSSRKTCSDRCRNKLRDWRRDLELYRMRRPSWVTAVRYGLATEETLREVDAKIADLTARVAEIDRQE